jgi:UDP-N-acetylmuramyl pentapeptide phosphotransferase/UDP-N-acetylglucosamine-1-phosphate transferase
MNFFWNWIVAPIAVFAGTLWLSGLVLKWLERRAILDHPVARSSHSVAVPRGGGLALVPIVLLAWAALAVFSDAPPRLFAIIAIAAVLAAISWRDDIGGLGAGWRFLAHAAAAILGLLALPETQPVFQGLLPPLLDRAVAVLLWIWFINLYNFMDGIDGITGTETVFIGLGLALIAILLGTDHETAGALGLTLAVGSAGFLCWNWPPARIFLGDVGSVPLGFMLGWLLLSLAAKGLWAPALILPLYYLADATLTLLMRVVRGERIWQAHRQHFYQRALAPDGKHRAVLRLIIEGNSALLILAAVSLWWPWPAVLLAALATATMLAQLQRRSRRQPVRPA